MSGILEKFLQEIGLLSNGMPNPENNPENKCRKPQMQSEFLSNLQYAPLSRPTEEVPFSLLCT